MVGFTTALEREGRVGHVDAGGQLVIGQDVNLEKCFEIIKLRKSVNISKCTMILIRCISLSYIYITIYLRNFRFGNK